MTFRATQDVVQRVRPLLERLATRTIDKARLLQYLSAMAGVDWGVLRLIGRGEAIEDGVAYERLTREDVASGAIYHLPCPVCLPARARRGGAGGVQTPRARPSPDGDEPPPLRVPLRREPLRALPLGGAAARADPPGMPVRGLSD